MPDQTLKDIKKDIYLLLHKAEEMLDLTEDAFTKNRLAALDKAGGLAAEIHKKEDALTEAVSRIAPSDAGARAIVSVPGHIEKVATNIERIIDNIRVKIKEGLLFSDKAIQETNTITAKAKEMLKKAGEAAVTGSDARVHETVASSEAIIRMASDFATAHEDRLVTGECSPKSSSTYLCMLYAFEDMAAHTRDALRKMAVK